ncbi:Protein DEFECTIVE IN MERISTEM SILENCING 3 [Zea mays]|uniref:Protein DEFECTIVE IN MERISTEM SILENCING 3 n=1 Tax=Zea mays TaxID=4577 RepID=A0A3L6F3Z6_MAIZE|nr:Protein DEFECTIVE IN MERISTEM SILENCING 3 [Zea mays]
MIKSALKAEQRTIRSILDRGKTTTTLGKVNNDNLSRLLTEYLGMDNMLALVCKTYDGVKGLDKYDKDDIIDKTSGVHGLGRAVGKFLDGRITVFCLKNLRPFSGDVIIDDPQRKLILHRPRLRGGESPPGFLDFVVNMIHLDRAHLRFLTASGHDGGLLRPNGSFCLGHSKNLKVKFVVTTDVSSLPENVAEMEEQVKRMNWEKEMVLEDMKREEDLLKQVKELYRKQKQELMDYVTQPAVTQTSRDSPATHSPATPGSNPFGAKFSNKWW